MSELDSAATVQHPEIVIGLTAAVGTPLELVQQILSEQLSLYGYRVEVLHLSSYADRFVLGAEPSVPAGREADRIDAMMTLGNEARRITEKNEILAMAAIADLRVNRGDAARPMRGRAFVLRQLKHPAEVELLRRTYREGFLLVGLYCPRRVREEYLASRGADSAEIERLVNRDEYEPSESGQRLRETFHLADVFIEVGKESDSAKAGIDRFLCLLFGAEIITPTMEEFGMFQAHAASLRSAQLGRQVGASILSQRGDVVAVGTNEVPRYGGGSYWEGEEPDSRDHAIGRDSSDEARERIVREIVQQTQLGWSELDPSARDQLVRDYLGKLRGTRVSALTEFGRAVHAEADALLAAARLGTSPVGASLYCTTFPCHVCAKHIVGAGIQEVVYIEPYPKSRALELHGDSIAIEEAVERRVRFKPFVGVAPRRFASLFSMVAEDGSQVARKDDDGRAIRGEQNLRLRMEYFSGPQREAIVAREFESIMTRRA